MGDKEEWVDRENKIINRQKRKIGDSRSDNWALQEESIRSKAGNKKLTQKEADRPCRLSVQMMGKDKIWGESNMIRQGIGEFIHRWGKRAA